MDRLETVQLPAGKIIHYSGLEGGVSFACGYERIKGEWWSQYQDHVTCPRCREWINRESSATSTCASDKESKESK